MFKYKITIYLKNGENIKIRSKINIKTIDGLDDVSLEARFSEFCRLESKIGLLDYQEIIGIIVKKWWQTWG